MIFSEEELEVEVNGMATVVKILGGHSVFSTPGTALALGFSWCIENLRLRWRRLFSSHLK